MWSVLGRATCVLVAASPSACATRVPGASRLCASTVSHRCSLEHVPSACHSFLSVPPDLPVAAARSSMCQRGPAAPVSHRCSFEHVPSECPLVPVVRASGLLVTAARSSMCQHVAAVSVSPSKCPPVVRVQRECRWARAVQSSVAAALLSMPHVLSVRQLGRSCSVLCVPAVSHRCSPEHVPACAAVSWVAVPVFLRAVRAPPGSCSPPVSRRCSFEHAPSACQLASCSVSVRPGRRRRLASPSFVRACAECAPARAPFCVLRLFVAGRRCSLMHMPSAWVCLLRSCAVVPCQLSRVCSTSAARARAARSSVTVARSRVCRVCTYVPVRSCSV